MCIWTIAVCINHLNLFTCIRKGKHFKLSSSNIFYIYVRARNLPGKVSNVEKCWDYTLFFVVSFSFSFKQASGTITLHLTLEFLLCDELPDFLIQLFHCLSYRTFLKNQEASPWRPSPSCGRRAERGLRPSNPDSPLNSSNIPDLYLHCPVVVVIIFKSDGWNCSQLHNND